MNWAFGEVRALSTKAARGFGMPWGLAEEAGFAVEWLEMRGLPGVEALARYLESAEHFEATHCPVAKGASISDFGSFDAFLPSQLYQPMLLTPFLGVVAGKQSIVLDTGQSRIAIKAIGLTGNFDELVATESVQACSAAFSNQTIAGDIHCATRVPETRTEFIKTLDHFAHKTYAPATEESRAKGAGAEVSDND